LAIIVYLMMEERMSQRTSAIVACLLLAATALAIVPAAGAQGDPEACPTLVEAALQAVDTACNGLGRGEACYGHSRVEVTSWDEAAELPFHLPADRVPLLDLRRLATAPLNLDAEEWGVAVLSLQTAVEGALPGQAVTFLLMGDTTLENAVPPEEPASDDGFGPMQAVYFASGMGRPACHDAPSALVVQAPSGTEVALRINDLDLTLGSTIVVATTTIPSPRGDVPVMVVALVQGHVNILLNGQLISMEQPSWEEPGPLPVYVVTLNAEGRVDANSQVIDVPLDTIAPTVRAACLDGLVMLGQTEQNPVCEAPLTAAQIPARPSEGEITAEAPVPGERRGTRLGLMWHLMACTYEEAAITSPVSFQWGVGCFDSAAHASAHPHPADYQLYVDGVALDMALLEQHGPEVHAPICPYGWGFTYPGIALTPGEHTVSLNETLTDTWHEQSGSRNAGETNTLNCTIVVARERR
jgi:hypothetical protein